MIHLNKKPSWFNSIFWGVLNKEEEIFIRKWAVQGKRGRGLRSMIV